MRIRKPLLAQLLLLVSLVGAFGFFDIYPVFHLLEVSVVCLMLLYGWLALSTKIDAKWVLYIFLPALGLGLFVLLYAYVFTLRVNAPMLPSILAQRYYAFVLLGPVVYMLAVRGWRLRDFQQVFLSAMFLAVATFFVADLVIFPSSILLSGHWFDLTLEQTYGDQARIFRDLYSSTVFLAFYFGRRLSHSRGAVSFLFSLSAMIVSIALSIFGVPRVLLVSVLVALLLYAAFLSRPGRINLSIIFLPLLFSLLVILAPALSGGFVKSFGQEGSYTVRATDIGIVQKSFSRYPLLGFGEDSAQSTTFQDLYGHFYPADVGMVGVAFEFGLLGVALYIAFVGWLCVNLLLLLWNHDQNAGSKQAAFLWALYLISLTFLISSPSQARFIYSQGLPIGAFCWGLLIAYRNGFLSDVGNYSRKRQKLTITARSRRLRQLKTGTK